MGIPRDLDFEVTIYSEAPGGASTGTSAAVTVALIGGLDSLTPGRLTPHEVALAAQKIETELLGQQCGIQDQLCCAYGGINYIEMFNYPHASVSQIQVPNSVWWELERRLVLVYLGKSHRSSQIHEMVIQSLENAGPDCKQLADLRLTASKSRDAVYAGDFITLGKTMSENTAAQERLHPALISPEAARVIEIAREYGALGWKVNGAGGDGGSVTLLCGDRSDIKRSLIHAIEQENPLFQNIPIYLSRYGLRVWTQTCCEEIDQGEMMIHLWGSDYTRLDLLRRLGDISQVAGAQPFELSDGRERGSRGVRLYNAAGLELQVIAERGLGITALSFQGVPLPYISPVGTAHPAYAETTGLGWLRNWPGGFLTPCGLTQVGSPCDDVGVALGLHGRVSNLPARNVHWGGEWVGEDYQVWVEGHRPGSRGFR